MIRSFRHCRGQQDDPLRNCQNGGSCRGHGGGGRRVTHAVVVVGDEHARHDKPRERRQCGEQKIARNFVRFCVDNSVAFYASKDDNVARPRNPRIPIALFVNQTAFRTRMNIFRSGISGSECCPSLLSVIVQKTLQSLGPRNVV